ncbi:MAG TPA: ABC-F family ATP-binding cassette domain-containing protein, partial [Gallicola sp.]|nr:ABC-F family ATP-binding cassette domain-containing protein [Gallicola sp.]
WLEDFINKLNIPIIFISHDETLLENTATGIIHFEQIKKKTESLYTIERITYSEYIEKRFNLLQKQEMVAKKQKSNYQKQMEKFRQIYQKVEHEQKVISRADPAGARLLKKKIKTLKSQEKRFEKDKENFLEIPDVEEAINLMFENDILIPNNKMILDLDISKLKIDNKLLASNIKLNISGPKHLVIIGKNGIGKTTLFKEIHKLLKYRNDINLGYMPQNYEDSLPLNELVINYLTPAASKEELTKSRTLLGSMKFTNEEASGLIKELSGGQKAKLLLIKLIIDKCNVLLLDEPTRNLSPLSNPVIRNILKNFKGTIISISHDRKYINEVCDVIYELTEYGLSEKNNLEIKI